MVEGSMVVRIQWIADKKYHQGFRLHVKDIEKSLYEGINIKIPPNTVCSLTPIRFAVTKIRNKSSKTSKRQKK